MPTSANADRRIQAALAERVKELTCLLGIAQLTSRPELSLDEVLQGVVNLLPPAWQFPAVTGARLTVGTRVFTASAIEPYAAVQKADVAVGGRSCGVLEVVYREPRPASDEGPFLKEERNLIVAVARQVGGILERREAGEEKLRLQDQLRHADRLATIGQLAAGVAHEMNEPLGNILGFAQLAGRHAGLPAEVRQDIDRIVTASLYAREIIRKLMMFARQTPPAKTRVDLNERIENGLSFFESRCAKAGISLLRRPDPAVPPITADPAQLNQVLVNLVVNALQAMPGGGTLTVGTRAEPGAAILVVEDTGVGMAAEIREKIFLPFFTTKDVNEGTGLGLSVVHGIVTAHGGTISVDSAPGRGSRFEVRLPAAGVEEGA